MEGDCTEHIRGLSSIRRSLYLCMSFSRRCATGRDNTYDGSNHSRFSVISFTRRSGHVSYWPARSLRCISVIERAIFFAQMDAGKAFANKFYTYMKFHKAAQAKQLAADSNGGLPLILKTTSLKVRGAPNGRPLSKCSRGFYLPPSQSSLLV